MSVYTRDDLERLALKTVSAELYYDLADTIGETDDDDLWDIIKAKGNYKKELELEKESKKNGTR